MQILKRRLAENTELKRVDHRQNLNGREAVTFALNSGVTASEVLRAASKVGFKVGTVSPILNPKTRHDDFHVFPVRSRFSIFVSPGRFGRVKIVRNGFRQPTLRDRQNIVKFFTTLTQ